MRVIFSSGAQNDLRRIGDYIAQENRVRARTFTRELAQKARELNRLSMGFPVVPDLAHLEIRRRVYGSYLILYRIKADRVMILRIVHGVRDYVSLFSSAE